MSNKIVRKKEKHKPILYTAHDANGYLQILCDENYNEDDAGIVSFADIPEIDESMADLAELDYGEYAEAEDETSDWVVRYIDK